VADKPCQDCQNYDPILRGGGPTKHGRCAVKSVYPNKEQPGQIFPVGVARVEPGELAKPVIVVGREVVTGCTQFRTKPVLKQIINPAKVKPRR
jgi:hypothetical protein